MAENPSPATEAEPHAPDENRADAQAPATPPADGETTGKTGEQTGEKLLSSSKVSLGKYEVDLSRPLSAFSHEYADAYECTSYDTGAADHVAIVIKDRYPVRNDYGDVLLGNNTITRLMELRARQVVAWPDDTRRFVLIFRRPPGQVVFPRHAQRIEPLSEDIIKRNIIRPVCQMLRGFSHLGLFHGAIRPDTLFMTAQENAECTVTECISAPPGANQPILYETIERGMAHPQGRGSGITADDIYALGVTVAILLRGANPLQGKRAEAILEDKLNFGSYVILVEGLRLGSGINEFLRGTLNDDPQQRWGTEQISAWLDGNRTTTKLSAASHKAQRSLDFNGKKYTRPRILAKDLYENIDEAVELIESGQLLRWVERAINNQTMYDAVNNAIHNANAAGRSSGFEDRLICFVSMALDPAAPIRFKDLRVFPNGIGYHMAMAYAKNQPVTSYTELVRDRYAWIWLNYKENYAPRFNGLLGILDQSSKLIIRRGIHFGLERVLYTLCPDAPCMSDFFKDSYVISCGGLLMALDAAAERYKDTTQPMDRHIAAFIMTQDNHDNAGFLQIYDSNDKIRRSLALLTLYQQLQKRFDNPKLENLCQWLARDAEAVIGRFHDQRLIKNLLKYLPKEIRTGDLSRVMALVDNPVQVKKDMTEFSIAQQQYARYNHELETIRMQLENNDNFGYESGRQAAVMIAMMLSGILVAATLLAHFVK